MSINAMYFLLIRRQRRPCLLAIDDGLSLADQHAGRGVTHERLLRKASPKLPIICTIGRKTLTQSISQSINQPVSSDPVRVGDGRHTPRVRHGRVDPR